MQAMIFDCRVFKSDQKWMTRKSRRQRRQRSAEAAALCVRSPRMPIANACAINTWTRMRVPLRVRCEFHVLPTAFCMRVSTLFTHVNTRRLELCERSQANARYDTMRPMRALEFEARLVRCVCLLRVICRRADVPLFADAQLALCSALTCGLTVRSSARLLPCRTPASCTLCLWHSTCKNK